MKRPELIEEIRQIISQYRDEVERERKPWPKAVKDRVAELLVAGLSAPEICRATGLAYHTVLKWRPSSIKRGAPRGIHVSKFKEVAVVPAKARAIAALQPTERIRQIKGTVTVTTPEGFKIEVQFLDHALELVTRLKGN